MPQNEWSVYTKQIEPVVDQFIVEPSEATIGDEWDRFTTGETGRETSAMRRF